MEVPRNKAATEELCLLLHLPNHLLTEILCRLPIKTLVGAVKCVCKSWLNLVSGDTHFAKLHRQRSPTTEFLLRSSEFSTTLYFGNLRFHNDNVYDVKLSLLFNLPASYIKPNKTIVHWGEIKSNCLNTNSSGKMTRNYPMVANLCNGLVCFESIDNSRFYSRDAVIANPITGEFVNVPMGTKWSKKRKSISTVNYRLGFSEKENRFKLLRAMYRANSSEQFAQICTLEEGSNWRDIGDCPHQISRYPGSESAILEHKLHYDVVGSGIAYFDFEKERFGVVPIPSSKHSKGFMFEFLFGVFGGCLFLSWLPDDGICNEIWVMKEYGVKDSWEKMFSVPFVCRLPPKQLENGVEDSCGKEILRACHVPIKQLENGEIIMCQHQGRLVLHNPSETTTRAISYGVEFSEVNVYSPTLLPLKDALAGYDACIHDVNSRRRSLTPGHPEEGQNTLEKLNKRTLRLSQPEGQNTLKKLNKRSKKRRSKS